MDSWKALIINRFLFAKFINGFLVSFIPFNGFFLAKYIYGVLVGQVQPSK